MAKYAARTQVSVSQSRKEIEKTLDRYGATGYLYGHIEHRVMIGFTMRDRQIRMFMDAGGLTPQQERQRWRALALSIKSKLEVVESGIEEFEDAFMAHIVLPNGMTMGQYSKPQIAQAYEDGRMPPLIEHLGK